MTNPHHAWAGIISMVSEVIFAGLGSVCTVYGVKHRRESIASAGGCRINRWSTTYTSLNEFASRMFAFAHPSTNATQWKSNTTLGLAITRQGLRRDRGPGLR